MTETDNNPQNLTTENALVGLGEFLRDKVAPAVTDTVNSAGGASAEP